MKSNKRMLRSIFNKYLVTVTLSEFTFSVCTLIDGILSGQYLGASALAAIGICAPFPSLLAILSGMLGAGCLVRCSYYMGRGEKENANRVFSTVVLVSMLVCAVLTFIFIAFAVPISQWFGATGQAADLLDESVDYLVSCAIGTVGMIMYSILSPIVQLEGKHAFIRAATFVLAFTNIIGDLLNMFVFNGGLFGVGLATAISNMAAAAVLAAALMTPKVSFKFSFRRIDFSVLPALLRKGSPKAVRRGCNSARSVFMNRLTMAAAGSVGVAALSVQGNLRAFSGAVGAGIATTMLMIAGVIYAEKDVDSLKMLFMEAIKKILTLVVPIMTALVVLAPYIVSLYIPEKGEAAEMAVVAVRCYSLALPFTAFNEIYINYFQGTGKTKASNIVSAFSRIGSIFICGMVLHAIFGIAGVWAAILLSEVFLSLGIIIYAMICGKNKKFLDRMLFIDSSQFENTSFYDAVISRAGEELGISKEIFRFCRENGVGKRRANLTSLFCEELSSNIVAHGFSDGKPHSIDLSVSVTGEELRIRMRDNCIPFNPKKWYEMNSTNEEDPAANIGIRIVMKMSKSFEYTTTFKMNNVIIIV